MKRIKVRKIPGLNGVHTGKITDIDKPNSNGRKFTILKLPGRPNIFEGEFDDAIYTSANAPTAEEFGVGPLWIDGRQYWSDGVNLIKKGYYGTDYPKTNNVGIVGKNISEWYTNYSAISPNTLYCMIHSFDTSILLRNIACIVNTVGLSGEIAKIGIWEAAGEDVGKLIFESNAISLSSTGKKIQTLSTPIQLVGGNYYLGLVTNSSTAKFNCSAQSTVSGPIGNGLFGRQKSVAQYGIGTGWVSGNIGDNPVPASVSKTDVLNKPIVMLNVR